jgi:formate hydrogenlyase subunit 3/multisubunit Na+/H+ antiporter MnhD subunit
MIRRAPAWLLVIGWLGSIFLPLIGLAAGTYILVAKAEPSDGARTSKYDAWSRNQAIAMIIVAIVIIVLGIALQAHRR